MAEHDDDLDDGLDDIDPEEAERQIAEFIDKEPRAGDLARQSAAIVGEAQERLAVLLGGEATNTVIATMLELSRQMRAGAHSDSPEHWRLAAASTLVSGLIGNRAPGT